MAVQFIIDSASDMTPEACAALGVIHLPLTVLFGQEEFADGVTMTPDEFYDKLSTNPNHPTTSQVTPAAFADAYQKVCAAGNEAVVITISSKLSGTYQSAVIAADDFEDRVFPVDSLTATSGEQVLLYRGLELAAQGLSAREIAETLNREKHSIRLYATLDTLEYLKKGGRISAATAVVGGLLNIKPAIAVLDGLVQSVGKARGAKGANTLLRQLVEQSGTIDHEKPVVVLHSGKSDANLTQFLADHGSLIPQNVSPIHTSIGAVIGTHAGPGAVGMAYFVKD